MNTLTPNGNLKTSCLWMTLSPGTRIPSVGPIPNHSRAEALEELDFPTALLKRQLTQRPRSPESEPLGLTKAPT